MHSVFIFFCKIRRKQRIKSIVVLVKQLLECRDIKSLIGIYSIFIINKSYSIYLGNGTISIGLYLDIYSLSLL